MVGAEERRKLMLEMNGEVTSPIAVVLKCLVGLVVLLVIVASTA